MDAEAQRYLGEALHSHRAGDLAEAERLCKRALKAAPRNAEALNLFGVLSFDVGRLERSLEMLHRAVELAPRNFEFRLNLSRTLQALGKYDRAANELRECLNESSENIEIMKLLESVLISEAANIRAFVEKSQASNERAVGAANNAPGPRER